MNVAAEESLIVALDFAREEEALALVRELRAEVRLFKIGLQLFSGAGPQIVRRVRELGAEVFLDLKLHDIPNTVAQAALQAARLGVRMLTLHSWGGRPMLQAAAQAVTEGSAREGWPRPLLLGVTVLTSLRDEDLRELGLAESIPQQVLRLARLAQACGLDGVVASPQELSTLRSDPSLSGLLRVTPGIRPRGSESQDQARILTPREALRQGAHYLVVGRPITASSHPLQSVRQLKGELTGARISEP